MSSKLNSEFNYRTQVIGETPWEKIKTLKGFLEGRKRAAALEQVASKKYQALVSEIEHLKSINALPHVILRLEAELIEIESMQDSQKEAFELNRAEIVCLEKLLDELFVIAEPTRIDGYSDEAMFEANAVNEFTATIGKDIYAELIAHGSPSAAKIRNAMSCPETWNALVNAGLIPKGNMLPIVNADPRRIELKFEEALKRKGVRDGSDAQA
jgi:hypothetical protein